MPRTRSDSPSSSCNNPGAVPATIAATATVGGHAESRPRPAALPLRESTPHSEAVTMLRPFERIDPEN